MIINQNIRTILRTFLDLKKKKKNLHQVNFHCCYYWICSKIPIRKKISNAYFNHCEAEISLDETIKSIKSETNNKPPGNDGFKAEFYKNSSNELTPVLLDVYDSWWKLDTMGVTYRTGITSAIYKRW